MPDDRFKRYQEAGNEFLESARARAEEFLRELAKATETTQKQAKDQVDDLVASGRRGTDQVLDVVRREVATQLSQMGLATKKDLAALERRMTGATAKKAPAKAATATKTTATGTAAKKVPAKKAPAKKAVATVKKAADSAS
jgi:polyhydroxyalkanoate synthesis regulator phasin